MLKNEINVGKQINSLLKSNKKIKGMVVPFIRTSNIIELIHQDIQAKLKVVGFDTTPKNISSLKMR
ncbi:MAG: hypothetical protein CBD95_004950 [Flavobacteriales bacterium TMED235]|nr:MAG: hypothetical protein CBD95_004950 [Flavobacteriales bacterium TMED235]